MTSNCNGIMYVDQWFAQPQAQSTSYSSKSRNYLILFIVDPSTNLIFWPLRRHCYRYSYNEPEHRTVCGSTTTYLLKKHQRNRFQCQHGPNSACSHLTSVSTTLKICSKKWSHSLRNFYLYNFKYSNSHQT